MLKQVSFMLHMLLSLCTNIDFTFYKDLFYFLLLDKILCEHLPQF